MLKSISKIQEKEKIRKEKTTTKEQTKHISISNDNN